MKFEVPVPKNVIDFLFLILMSGVGVFSKSKRITSQWVCMRVFVATGELMKDENSCYFTRASSSATSYRGHEVRVCKSGVVSYFGLLTWQLHSSMYKLRAKRFDWTSAAAEGVYSPSPVSRTIARTFECTWCKTRVWTWMFVHGLSGISSSWQKRQPSHGQK